MRSLSWRLWSESPTRDGALLGLVFVSTALSYTRFRVLTNKQTCRHNGDECAAIGIATKHFPLYGKFPGWDQHSYAYHSDDGNKFHGFGMVRHRRRAKCRNETNHSHQRMQPPKPNRVKSMAQPGALATLLAWVSSTRSPAVAKAPFSSPRTAATLVRARVTANSRPSHLLISHLPCVCAQQQVLPSLAFPSRSAGTLSWA